MINVLIVLLFVGFLGAILANELDKLKGRVSRMEQSLRRIEKP